MMKTSVPCAHSGCDRHATIGRFCRSHDPNPPRRAVLAWFDCIVRHEIVEAHRQIVENELTAVLQRPERDAQGRWRAPFVAYLDGRFVGQGTTEADVLHIIEYKRKGKIDVALE